MTYDGEAELAHEVEAWTVGQLREAMAGLPDDMPVTVLVSEEPGGEFADEQVVVSAAPWSRQGRTADEVRAKLASGELQPDHLEIGLEFPSGRYYRAARS